MMFSEFLDCHPLNALLFPNGKCCLFPVYKDRAAWDALPMATRKELCAWGDEALQGYPARPATAFLAFVRTGDRQADETPYFMRRRRLIGAVLAECALNDGCHLDAVVDGLWCICEETSWVISAHNGSSHEGARPAVEHPLPDPDNPYVDLFSAQTAATLAFTLHLLSTKLDSVTPMLARRVRGEIDSRVVQPFLARDDFWWMGFMRRDLSNWTPWILSNIMDACILLERDDARLCEILSRAMRMLDRYLAVQPTDGGCDEGCGYWNMAGGSLLDCLESLRIATGGRVDFYQEPLIRAIGEFPLKAHIADDWFWNFADCDAKPMLDGERLYTYGARIKNPELMALGATILRRNGTVASYKDTPQMNRILLQLFTDIAAVEAPVPQASRTIVLPQLQVYAMEQGGLYAAIKGGNNGESHNHNDVGTFLLYVDGKPCVVDAGNLTYTAKTFSSERYSLWNVRSAYHNLPMIGGIEQQAGRQYEATDIQQGFNHVCMSLRKAYPEEADLASLTRCMKLDTELTVSDSLELTLPQPVTWVFMLREPPDDPKPYVQDPTKLAIDFGCMRLCYPRELIFACEVLPVLDARMARCFSGNLYRITLTAAPSQHHQQSFHFRRK